MQTNYLGAQENKQSKYLMAVIFEHIKESHIDIKGCDELN